MHKTIISILLLTSVGFAEQNYPFIGGESSLVNYGGSTSSSIGLKYGIQNGMWRGTLNLEYAKSTNNSLTSFLYEADRGILADKFKNLPFKPHAGFSLGMYLHKKDKTKSGMGYGVNTGITYILNDMIDVDLTYRYIKVSNIDDLNHLNSLNLSLHYFY